MDTALNSERRLEADHTTIGRWSSATVPNWNSGCAVISSQLTSPGDLPPKTSPEGDRWARIEGRIESLIQDRVRSRSHDFSR